MHKLYPVRKKRDTAVGIMLGCIKALKELGTSIVLISHNRSDLDAVCDRTVELRNGILLGAEDGE